MSKAANPETDQSNASKNGSADAVLGGDSSNGTRAEAGTPEISADTFFELLSNRRRRYALHCLERESESVELGELARQIAAWENGKEVNAITASERKNVYTSLQQFHLPKLDNKGVVEFDERDGTVELGPASEDYDIYMEVVERGNVPWSHYYLGLAGVHALAVVAASMSLVTAGTAGTFCVTTLLVSALAHTYYTKSEMRLGAGETPPKHDT